MSENLIRRERRRELLITLSYTIFSVFMIIETTIQRWPIIYIPIISAEIAVVWWSYITKFQTYTSRAFMVAGFICLNIFLYGIQGENFNVLIPTLSVQFVLLSLYELTQIMSITILQTLALLLYHIAYKHTFIIPEGTTEKNRMLLQLVSFVILIVLCIYRIHHHNQEEIDFADLENRVRKEQKIKNDFVANTSHELRTPINTIAGMSEILLQRNLPDEIHSSVLDIQMTSSELNNLVTDILDYASLEADSLDLNPREYSITSTINDVMNMTVYENREKQLEIIFDCDPNIPRLLYGDEYQLRRVLNNLISNAIKFTSEGGVMVRVSYRPEEYGINLIVSVKDSGVGIGLEEQDEILRGFYQTESDRSSKRAGMGLGLTISSELVKRMGGFLTVKSREGKGSEFSFAIPQKVIDEKPCISLARPNTIRLVWYYKPQSNVASIRDAFVEHIRHFSDYFGIINQQAASLEECKRRVSQGQGVHLIIGVSEYMEDKRYFDRLAATMPVILVADRSDSLDVSEDIHILYKPYNAMILAEIFNGRKEYKAPVRKEKRRMFSAPNAKVLVVDDNLMNLKVVEGLLRKYKIRIVGANSGEEALSLIESKDYDFVFMDHMMPGMDGIECFHHIREKEGSYYKRVPIIALTANAIAGSREMFLEEGFNDFVAKPVDTALLNEVLQRFIPLEKQIEEGKEVPETDAGAGTDKGKTSKKKPASSTGRIQSQKSAAEEKIGGESSLPDGIDMDSALMYCGSIEDFRDLVEIYCSSGDKYAVNLQKAYDEMDFKNYALIAHTIKSTSRTLGATGLSELAYTMEMAGKGEQDGVIKANHHEFVKQYKDVLTGFNKYLGASGAGPDTGDSEDEGGEIEDFGALKAELISCLETFETKSFEDALRKVKGRTLGGVPIEKVLEEVTERASNFDFDGAISELNEIGD